MQRTLTLLLMTVASATAQGDPLAFGDPDARKDIDATTHKYYDSIEHRAHKLTRDNPLGIPHPRGTELNAQWAREGAGYGRIVTFAWSDSGKLNAEYYYDAGSLLFVFEAFEPFEGTGWERRTYLRGENIVYAEASGSQPLSSRTDARRLSENAARLLRLVAPQPSPH